MLFLFCRFRLTCDALILDTMPIRPFWLSQEVRLCCWIDLNRALCRADSVMSDHPNVAKKDLQRAGLEPSGPSLQQCPEFYLF